MDCSISGHLSLSWSDLFRLETFSATRILYRGRRAQGRAAPVQRARGGRSYAPIGPGPPGRPLLVPGKKWPPRANLA
jgi:hypothetical protein